MKKALIYSLSLALLLVSLTACHKSQADQPTEPDPPQAATSTQADVSTPEPLAPPEPEPPDQTPAPPDQLSDTTPADLDKTEASQPPEETTPMEPAPEQLESIHQQQVSQSNSTGSQQQTQQQTGGTQQQQASGSSDPDIAEIERIMKEQFLKDNEEAKANGATIREGDALTDKDIADIGAILNSGQPQQNTQKVWDQSFYNTLTPEQKAMYELEDDHGRQAMKQSIEADRQLAKEGYEGAGNLTEEEVNES